MTSGADYFLAVLESTADGILVVDRDGKVVTANRRFAELWRIPDDVLERGDDEEMVTYVLEQLIDPQAFLDRVRELYGSAQETLDVLRFHDGRTFERFSAPLMRDGELSGRVWSFRDITETRRAELALRESEARFRSLYNLAPVMLHSTDADRRIVDVNDYWLERMGYAREEVLGKRSIDFLTEESRRQAEKVSLPRFFETGSVRDVPHRFVTKGGEAFDGLLSAVGHFDDDGTFLRSFAAVVDISEQKRAAEQRQRLERQILHAQKLESLGVLAGGIAHDFNNLLVSILGNADLALGHLPSEGPGRELLLEVVAAGQRAAELCSQLLAYSGSGRFHVEPVDLGEVAREMTHLLEVSIPKRVELVCEFEEGLPAVEVDVSQVRQVLMNLITNAGEAIGDREGRILVRIRARECGRADLDGTMFADDVEPGRYVSIVVEDDGRGMDADVKQRIFDPFFSSKAPGRGLGLAATLGIVRGHGGTLSVSSEPEVGAVFEILLPACELPAVPVARPAVEQHDDNGDELVLVVDDEEGVRNVARRILERAGFRVLTAARGEEALTVHEEHAGELEAVLLDLTMPGMGGEETLRELRRRDTDLAIVLSSGFDAESAMRRLTGRARPDAFVHKPYLRRELVQAVREALDAHASRG